MSKAFKAHVDALLPGTSSEAELMEASRSTDALLAYADARNLTLSREEAERVASAAHPSPLDDSTLEAVSGGRRTGEFVHKDKPGEPSNKEEGGFLKWVSNPF